MYVQCMFFYGMDESKIYMHESLESLSAIQCSSMQFDTVGTEVR
jgi:hypothetical protein